MLEAEKSRGVQYIGILIDLRLVSMQPLRDACVTIHVQICVTILVCVRHRAGMEDFAPQRDLIKGGGDTVLTRMVTGTSSTMWGARCGDKPRGGPDPVSCDTSKG